MSAPLKPSEILEAERLAKLVANKCQEKFGDWLPFMGTRDVARDLDVLRDALGEFKLTYICFSYGTYLGAIYAEMFPARTERLVLDGAMDPSLEYTALRRDQAQALESAIGRFALDCAMRSDCPLPADPAGAVSSLRSLVETLDAHPYMAPDCRVLSGSRAVGLIQSATYFPPDTWKKLQPVLGPAMRGEFQPMLELAHSPALMVNPADTPYLAVMCHDLAMDRDVVAVPALAAAWKVNAPFNGASRAWSTLPCRWWSARAAIAPRPIRVVGAGPILVIGTTHDPATPVVWAKALRRQIRDAHYLEWNGDGHLASGGRGRASIGS